KPSTPSIYHRSRRRHGNNPQARRDRTIGEEAPMLIRKPADIPYSQVTPKELYFNRRRFLAAGGAALAAAPAPFTARVAKIANFSKSNYNVGKERITPLDIISGYNNYYEFGTGKEEPAINAPKWKPDPAWPVQISGEVAKPKTMSLDEIMKLAPLE